MNQRCRPHLYVTLSAHGLGHLAQTAAVLNRLRERLPIIRLTVQSALETAVLARRIGGRFTHVAEAVDIGLLMADPARVRVPESLAAYRAFHADWDRRLQRQIELLASHQPDLVLANVPYLPLAACHRLGVPSLAMCSLNWADLLEHFSDSDPRTRTIVRDIREAYGCAGVFLQPQPSMPMPGLENRTTIGPVACSGRPQRRALCKALGIRPNDTLVLVTLGGIEGRLAMERWHRRPGIHWLTPQSWQVARDDCHPLEETNFGYLDALASCDALLTKPGYGSFAEAACAAVPVLYVGRVDWPEEPYLVDWLAAHGRVLRLTEEDLARGDVIPALAALLDMAPKPAVVPSGVDDAVSLLLQKLSDRSQRQQTR